MAPKSRKRRKAKRPPVSLGGTALEDLPLPLVYYPPHYGTFMALAEDGSSTPALCACCESAVTNLLRLSDTYGYASLRGYFPEVMIDKSAVHLAVPFTSLRFEQGLCHRCTGAVPSLLYCHPVYGGRFMQQFGWYVNQEYLRLGISPLLGPFLPDVCPPELQEDIRLAVSAMREHREEYDRLMAIVQGPKREDIGDDEITYWSNVRMGEAEDLIRLRRLAARKTTAFTKKVENIARQKLGFRKVGEGWVSETSLSRIVQELLPGQVIQRHARPDWLEGLELDIYLPELGLAIEYQGQQHFHPIEAWGGQEALEKLQERDARKAGICNERGIRLTTVDYTEPLTREHIRHVLQSSGVTLERNDISDGVA